MMAKIVATICLLLIVNFYYASAIGYQKRYSNGLDLPASTVFEPIYGFGTTVDVTKYCSVLVHYQITLETENAELFTMLTMNDQSVGSVVHSGRQAYKTATGFYMANFEPGKYRFQVHYKSPVPIYTSYDWDWETGIIQAMWFEGAHVVSDGIKCPTTTNAYNNWGPIRDIEAVLNLSNDSAVLSAYQLSTEMATPRHVVTSLVVDDFFYNTATFLKGNTDFLDLHGIWARNIYAGPHFFNIHYRSPSDSSFTDCGEAGFTDHKNLYAMMLSPSCQVAAVIRPETTLNFNDSNEWAPTDIKYSLTLSNGGYVLIMYQYSGRISGTYIVMRLSIDDEPQRQTASLTGNTLYVGNFGLLIDKLTRGTHQIVLEYRSPGISKSTVSSDIEWKRYNKWMNRAMTVITCQL